MWFAVLYEVKVTWVASVSMWVRQESWEESKNEEWRGAERTEGNTGRRLEMFWTDIYLNHVCAKVYQI